MKHRNIAQYFVLLMAVLLTLSCASESDNPAMSYKDLEKGTVTAYSDGMASALAGVESYYYVYTPAGYDSLRTEPYPLLVLLNGYNESGDYFYKSCSVTALADEMIAAGDIEPMVLLLPNGKNNLGGTFYTNSTHLKVEDSYDHLQDLIDYTQSYYNVSTEFGEMGIGGFCMGGFGAVKTALETGDYGSVSSVAGPLSLVRLLDQSAIDRICEVVGYQPAIGEITDSVETRFRYSFSNYYYSRVTSDSDSLFAKMILAMSAAFSPTERASGNYVVTNTTLTNLVVSIDSETGLPVYDRNSPVFIDLPFGADGQIDNATFSRWLENDPHTLLSGSLFQNLANASLFLSHGDSDEFIQPEITESFVSGPVVDSSLPDGYLQVSGSEPDYYDIYSAIAGYTADHSSLNYEELRKILLFHDSVFRDN